ncbi:MAG: DNA gyrase inhibitor YacG [Deltaproteobacteria bacterium]|nr:DNA gyrase inhibitor YacG [Deltaproteobacteria bacterium]
MPAPRCPICDTPLTATSGDAADALRWRPFCSKRCKLVDLSKWLGEEYRVPGPALGDGGPLGAGGLDELTEHE